MKVFVAYNLDYDSNTVQGVFSTLENAEEYLLSHRFEDDSLDGLLIEETGLDNPEASHTFWDYTDGEWRKMIPQGKYLTTI